MRKLIKNISFFSYNNNATKDLTNEVKISFILSACWDRDIIRETYVTLCTVWYHLYNFKNVKNTHRGVLLLVKLQAPSCRNQSIDLLCKSTD